MIENRADEVGVDSRRIQKRFLNEARMKRSSVALLCVVGLSLAWACGGGGGGGTGGGSASGGGTASSGGGTSNDGGTGGGTAGTGGGTAATGGGMSGTGTVNGDGGFTVIDARGIRSALDDGGENLQAVAISLADRTVQDLCSGAGSGTQAVTIEIVNTDGGAVAMGTFPVVAMSSGAQGTVAAVVAVGNAQLLGTGGSVIVTQIDATTVAGSYTAQLIDPRPDAGQLTTLTGAFNVPSIVCP
jgi:hypothetical protein